MTDCQKSEPTKCTVISCPNLFREDHFQQSRRFFSFPSDAAVSQIWREKCGVAADHPTENARVCSEHFRPSDYTTDKMVVLKADALPQENLGWMIGMPEAKRVEPRDKPKFEEIKQAVDTNERLKRHFEKMLEDKKSLMDRIERYKKKVDNVQNEIFRLQNLLAKYPMKKKKKVDANLICKVFSQAQINMLLGKNKVVWSYDDMAMAFTLRHIGNKECYLYLKDTLNMPLPSLSAVQRWVASNKSKEEY